MTIAIPFAIYTRTCGNCKHSLSTQLPCRLESISCCQQLLLNHAVSCCALLCLCCVVLCHAVHQCYVVLCMLCYAVLLATYVLERTLPTVRRRWLHMCAMCWPDCTVNPMIPPLSCAWRERITKPTPAALPLCRQCSATRSWNGHAVKVYSQFCNSQHTSPCLASFSNFLSACPKVKLVNEARDRVHHSKLPLCSNACRRSTLLNSLAPKPWHKLALQI